MGLTVSHRHRGNTGKRANAKALLGKQVHDDVKVLTPDGEAFYTVTNLRYTG